MLELQLYSLCRSRLRKLQNGRQHISTYSLMLCGVCFIVYTAAAKHESDFWSHEIDKWS